MQPKEFLNLLLFSCCCLHVNRVGASLLPGRSAFQAGDAVREATKAANGMDSLIQPTEGLKGGIDLSKSLKPDDLSTLRGGTTEVDNGLPKTKDLATLQKPASDVPPISGKSPATAGRPNHISIDSKMSSYEKWKLKAWTAFMKRLGKKQQKTVVDVPKMKDKFFDVQEPSSTPASPATSGKTRWKPALDTIPEHEPPVSPATTGKTPLKPALDTTPEHEPPVFPATRYKTRWKPKLETIPEEPSMKPSTMQRVWKAMRDGLMSLHQVLRRSEGLIPALIRKFLPRTRPATAPSV